MEKVSICDPVLNFLNLMTWRYTFKQSYPISIFFSQNRTVPYRFCLIGQKVVSLNLTSMDLHGDSLWITVPSNWISVTYFPCGFRPSSLFWPHTSPHNVIIKPTECTCESAVIRFSHLTDDLVIVYSGLSMEEWGDCANTNTLTHLMWFIQAEECVFSE